MNFITNLYRGRINRRNFLLGWVLNAVLSAALLLIPIFLFRGLSDLNFNILFGIMYLMFNVIMFSLIVRRSHDLGYSALFLLLLLIPFIDFIYFLMLFVRNGQDKENKYGKKPLGRISVKNAILNLK